MQQHFDLGILPVKAILLVADILDGGAGDRFDFLGGDRFGAACFAGITARLVVQRVSQAARMSQGLMPSGPSRKNRSTTSSEMRSLTLSG